MPSLMRFRFFSEITACKLQLKILQRALCIQSVGLRECQSHTASSGYTHHTSEHVQCKLWVILLESMAKDATECMAEDATMYG